MVDHGVFGYGFDDQGYRDGVCWWQSTHHGWSVDPDWIVATQGLGHAIAMVLQTFAEPGEGACFFTPVYHEFRSRPNAVSGARSRSPWPATGIAMCWISTRRRPPWTRA
jgi:cystathionine beta-lyase